MSPTPLASRSDVVVVGAGLAGLTAALQLRATGRRVTLIHKGIGGLQLSQGSVDVLGYAPERVERPLEAIPGYVADKPEHPYAVIPAGAVRRGVQWLADTLGTDLLVGDADANVNLPTAVGAVRPTALAMPSMMNGACTPDAKFVIVGPRQF
ncbi:MAG: FAD-dependent oxidoreductase, partial [Propionibacterium sp.]|nr:FAD-dependent oxidoreductase [Propionibacterium sp.]